MFSTNFQMFLRRNSSKHFSLAFRSFVSLFGFLLFCFSHWRPLSMSCIFLPIFSLLSIHYHFFVPPLLYSFTYKHKCLPDYQAFSPVLSSVSLFLSLKILTPTLKCAHDKKIRRKLNFEKYFTLSKPCFLTSRTKPTSL